MNCGQTAGCGRNSGESCHPYFACRLATSRTLLAVLLFSLLPPFPLQSARAEEVERPADQDLPTSEKLQARIRDVEASKQVEDPLKTKILGLYRLAASQLDAAEALAAKEASYREAVQKAPSETARIRKLLEAEPPPPPAAPVGAKTSDLETQLVQAQAEATTLRSNLKDLDAQIQAQAERPSKSQEELTAAKGRLEQIAGEQGLPPPSGESPILKDARLSSLRARMHASTMEVRALEQENVSHAVRLDLLKARRDLSAREIAVADARIKVLQDALAGARRTEAAATQSAAEAASKEAIGKHPLIRDLAQENVDLGAEIAKVADKIVAVEGQIAAAKSQRAAIEEDFKSVRDKLEIAGVSDALGMILRQQRRSLPDVRQYKAESLARQGSLAEAGLRQFRLDEETIATRDVGLATRALLESRVDPKTPEDERSAIASQAQDLIKKKQELVNKLTRSYADYRGDLFQLDAEEKLVVEAARKYAAYLDERLLWVPNLPAVGRGNLRDASAAVRWFLSPGSWLAAAGCLLEQARARAVTAGLVTIAVVALLFLRSTLRRKLESIAARVGKVYTDSFLLTLAALGITILLAVPWPLLLGYLGYLFRSAASVPGLGADSDLGPFLEAVGTGLASTATILWVFISFHWVFAPSGLGPAHFRWSPRVTSLILRHMKWLGPVVIPAGFVVSVTASPGTPVHTDALGRIAFSVAMAALAVFAQRVLKPQAGLFDRLTGGGQEGWIWGLRYVWYPLAVATPIFYIAQAAIGYYYTAVILCTRVLYSVWVLVRAVILYDLVRRWFRVARTKLALAKAIERRQAKEGHGTGSLEGIAVELEKGEIDLSALDDQVRQLLRAFIAVLIAVGLWLVWVDIIPALSILHEVQLWPYSVMVDGKEVLRPVTLANLILAVIIGALATIAAKNIPALLEVVVLRNLPFDAGSRYAMTTLCRYAIVTVGAIAAFHAIGVGWDQVRWLVAAVGLGLGFGLQEIFANLVSGIMILFERPFRIGDVVTVGDVTGIVSRIRMRATTLLDWDNREHLVPNKTFITDRVINWTLSDQTTRLVMKVGIAYGSDTIQAQAVLLEAARSHPLVLAEPPPSVFFVGFAESSLDFEVRVFVRKIDDRMQVLHEVNTAIHKVLNEKGIEIPFPQRDIHIRSKAEG